MSKESAMDQRLLSIMKTKINSYFVSRSLINNSVLVFCSSNKQVLFVILKRIVQL